MTKTLRVELADLEGIPHSSARANTTVTVTAAYTGPVILTDGTIIPTVPKSESMGSNGRVDFTVYTSDSPDVREDHHGFAVRVDAEVTEPSGRSYTYTRTVKPLEYQTDIVRLGRMPSAEGLPPQWVSIEELADSIRDNLAADISTPGNPAYEALVDVAGTLSDPQTAGLIGDLDSETRAALDTLLESVAVDDSDVAGLVAATDSSTRAALDALLEGVEVDLTDYPTKGEVAADLEGYVSARDAESIITPIAQAATAQAVSHLPIDATSHGVTSDGITDDTSAMTALLGTGTGTDVVRMSGNTRLTGPLNITEGTVHVVGGPGATLTSESTGLGVRIEPDGTSIGTTRATTVGATTVTLTGASMTPGEHVGKWLKIIDPAINPLNGEGTHHWRRITANTETALTVEHGIGHPIPAGLTAEVVTPLDRVEIRDLTIHSTASSGAMLVVRAAREVVLDNVKIIDAGDYATGRGNGIAIYHGDTVRVSNCDIRRSGSFGMIVYNSDDVRVSGVTAREWGSQFGIQLKDCRSGIISSCTAIGDNTKSDDGINIKCSGLNPSHDVQIIDCRTADTSKSGFQFSSITAEGTGFVAENYRASGCFHRGGGGAGFMTISDAGSRNTIAGWTFESCRATSAWTAGFSLTQDRVTLQDCSAQGTGFEGIHVSADDVTVTGGTIQDCSQRYTSGAARSSEVLLQGARGRVSGTRFIRTASGKTIRAVRDVAGASHSTVQDCVISDYAGGYSQDYVLNQAGDTAIGRAGGDYFAGSTAINKRQYVISDA